MFRGYARRRSCVFSMMFSTKMCLGKRAWDTLQGGDFQESITAGLNDFLAFLSVPLPSLLLCTTELLIAELFL
jgi:hypothetical protein